MHRDSSSWMNSDSGRAGVGLACQTLYTLATLLENGKSGGHHEDGRRSRTFR
jgi:hypothetical protein